MTLLEQASPGNLAQFEEILFGGGGAPGEGVAGVVGIRVGSGPDGQRVVGVVGQGGTGGIPSVLPPPALSWGNWPCQCLSALIASMLLDAARRMANISPPGLTPCGL